MRRMQITGKVVRWMGILLLIIALCLICYNIWDADRAGRSAEQAAEQLEEYREDTLSATMPEEEDPNRPMPEVTVDGISYIGNLQVPSLGLDLPVITSWSYQNLKIAPCRYTGSIFQNNMVLAAHNYSRHFGAIRNLDIDTEVRFVDMEGNIYRYAIAANEILEPTEIDKMIENDYDLTLFTCVNSGQARQAIRCNRVSDHVERVSQLTSNE